MILTNILFIVILIGLNAFFVAVEFSAVTSRLSRLVTVSRPGSYAHRLVQTWLENPTARDRLIAATQIGITAASLALGAVGENTFQQLLLPLFNITALPPNLAFVTPLIQALPILLSLILITSIHVVFGEQVPKVAVLRAPERFALAAAPVMNVFTNVFRGIIRLLDGATRLVLRSFGLPDASPHAGIASLDELRQIVTGPEVQGVIAQPEQDMLEAVINFSELVVSQVSIPRMEMIAVEANASLREVVELALQHPFTKFPVYEESLDHIVGILHIRDVLLALQDETQAQIKASQLAREAIFIPETISVNNLLIQFRSKRTHIAVVLDEFGGTAGLVTLADLIDEIVGEMETGLDQQPPDVQFLPDGSALIDGMTLIDDINEQFGLSLDEPNYITIAGYILGRLGRIPKIGDFVDVPVHNVRLKVETMDQLRIARVSLRHL